MTTNTAITGMMIGSHGRIAPVLILANEPSKVCSLERAFKSIPSFSLNQRETSSFDKIDRLFKACNGANTIIIGHIIGSIVVPRINQITLS